MVYDPEPEIGAKLSSSDSNTNDLQRPRKRPAEYAASMA